MLNQRVGLNQLETAVLVSALPFSPLTFLQFAEGLRLRKTSPQLLLFQLLSLGSLLQRSQLTDFAVKFESHLLKLTHQAVILGNQLRLLPTQFVKFLTQGRIIVFKAARCRRGSASGRSVRLSSSQMAGKTAHQ